jgi:hypothetical protein
VTEEPQNDQQAADTAFETFAATWVPPWAREATQALQQVADFAPEELGVGRFA